MARGFGFDRSKGLGERLVDIITERDLMNVAAELLEEQLRESS